MQNSRYEELDSIRGIAALTVVFGHLMYILPIMNESSSNSFLVKLLTYTPIHVIWSGHEAVIIFFILSGFVLSLPFYSGKQPKYTIYILKRFFRIYLPYIVSIIIAISARCLFFNGNVKMASSWFNNMWKHPLDFNSALNHLFLIGVFDSVNFNTVIWSLVHEMRISILFPIIMYLVIKLNWKKSILLGFVLSCLFAVFGSLFKPEYGTNLYVTLHYIFMFIIGALIAKHRETLISHMRNTKKINKFLICVFSILAYSYPWLFYSKSIIHKVVMNDWVVSIGATFFLLIGLSSIKLSSILKLKPVLFIGKISYSLYLYHMIVILSLVHIFNDVLPLFFILIISIPLSIVVATIAWYLVEKPSIKLGKKLSLPVKTNLNIGVRRIKL